MIEKSVTYNVCADGELWRGAHADAHAHAGAGVRVQAAVARGRGAAHRGRRRVRAPARAGPRARHRHAPQHQRHHLRAGTCWLIQHSNKPIIRIFMLESILCSLQVENQSYLVWISL